ncbi:MAG: c-type cytochrome biogenesis protein CcsB [Anaerolineae bacterium]|nr:c-type cytochrome biogenesis protein CcsB [Anaerolineae bacterium]
MLIRWAYIALWAAFAGYVAHARARSPRMGLTATGLTTLAWALWTAGLVQRGWTAGHWPLATRYEVALCFTWAVVTIYLILETSWGEHTAGAYVLPIALFIATYAITRPATARASAPLLPALRSAWLQVHVVSAVIGYGSFGVAAGLGLMHWMQKSSENARQEKQASEIEQHICQVIGWGFPWLTLGILSGAIWAQAAWGRYWGWDPKETWALITWLWYLLIFHARTLPRWRGRRLATLAVAGFGVIWFTFAGVPWLVRVVRLQSLHGF